MITIEIVESSTELTVEDSTTLLEIQPRITVLETSLAIAPGRIQNLDPEPALDVTVDGLKVELTASENLVFGDICYLDSSGKWAKGSASSEATARALVMAAETIVADAKGGFLLIGFARNDAWSWTVPGELYLSETSGEMTQTVPSTPNSVPTHTS